MIKSISGAGRYIQVLGGTSSNPYISPGVSGAGMVRWNSNMSSFEINDGNSWQQLHTAHPMISLTSEAESLLDWARRKRDEELEREELAKTNPAIKDLLDQIKFKEDQLKMVQTLLNSPGYDHIKPSMVP